MNASWAHVPAICPSGSADFGTSGPVFLAGAGIKSGLHATTPSLTNLAAGDLKMAVDFRSVYATILIRWLALDAQPVLSGEFPLFSAVTG